LVPINIMEDNTVKFIVEFISSATGNLVSPTSASVTVNYFVSGVATSTTIELTQQNSFWVGTWDTTGADLGIVTYTTASSETTNPASTGELRIIQ
jgi:hypothetical protein